MQEKENQIKKYFLLNSNYLLFLSITFLSIFPGLMSLLLVSAS